MKLFCDINENIQVLTEEPSPGQKNYFIEGIFLQGNITNRNKRRYPMETLQNEVGRYNDNFVKQKRAFGELGHPEGPTINLERVSHMITELRSLEERNGVNVVKDDFQLATAADIVADPSAPEAFVRGIMEGKEWIWESGRLIEADIEQIKKDIRKSSSRHLEETKMNVFNKFLRGL